MPSRTDQYRTGGLGTSRCIIGIIALLACILGASGEAFFTFCADSRAYALWGLAQPDLCGLYGVTWTSFTTYMPSMANLTSNRGAMNVTSWTWGAQITRQNGQPMLDTFRNITFQFDGIMAPQFINAALTGKNYSALLILEWQAAAPQDPYQHTTAWYIEEVAINGLQRNFTSPNTVSWTVDIEFAHARHYAFTPDDSGTPQPHIPRSCIPREAGCYNVPSDHKGVPLPAYREIPAHARHTQAQRGVEFQSQFQF